MFDDLIEAIQKDELDEAFRIIREIIPDKSQIVFLHEMLMAIVEGCDHKTTSPKFQKLKMATFSGL
ncbi:MAG: hypothetical protein ACHQJ6_07570 [Candidatus Berkiellales bacterium]